MTSAHRRHYYCFNGKARLLTFRNMIASRTRIVPAIHAVMVGAMQPGQW